MGLIVSLVRAFFEARKKKAPAIIVLDCFDQYDLRAFNYLQHTRIKKKHDFWYNQHGQGAL